MGACIKTMKKKQLSVVLATYNEAVNIARCLDSVKSIADELIVVDGGSTDATVSIAKQYNAKVIETDNPPIFHINKQKAVDAAKYDWILVMDADEELPKKSQKEIVGLISSNPKDNGFWIPRKNMFAGKWMRYGGMYPDYNIRLFRKGKGVHPCKSVHEMIDIDGSVGHLHEPMIHHTYPTVTDYFKKANAYTSLTATEIGEGKEGTWGYLFLKYVVARPITTFISLYIRHKGILDGWRGFLWAFFSGFHFMWAYIKYQINKLTN
jgi:glycosyltransferase involved in cell wall biosynthesis